MNRHEFGEICRARRLCWGTVMLEYMTPQVVRAIARAGFQWIWIDNEHGHHAYETIYQVARTAEDLGVMTMLRVAQAEYPLIAQALDMAVSGIIVPRVETPEQARHIVDCAKYPPVGKRGFGMRSSLFGKRSITMAERIEDQNRHRFLAIQIESRKGVRNVAAMLDAGDGYVDAVYFGPADFQMDLGRPDSPDDPELLEAARHMTSVCAERHVSNGVPATSAENAQHWIDLGFNLITLGSDDSFLFNAAIEACESLRALESGGRPGAQPPGQRAEWDAT